MKMKQVIVKPVNELAIHVIIPMADLSTWRDGKKEWYNIKRDYRPDAISNVQELGDDSKTYYMLYKLAHDSAGLEGTNESIKHQLTEIKQLYELADSYANHLLAQLLDEYEKYEDEPQAKVI